MNRGKVIFATYNTGKLREVKHILSDLDIELLSLPDFDEYIKIEENGNSFFENASIKAKAVYAKFGLPVIADDSGIVVEQLNGYPGIFSARYAGEDSDDIKNNIKLLEELKKYPEPHTAKFVCAAVYMDETVFFSAHGEIRGKIIKEPRGSNGFGYDPLFLPDGYSVTSAELEPEEKNRISHRARAFIRLKELIAGRYGVKK